MKKNLPTQVVENRSKFLSVLRSDKYPKGTIKSDENGKPVIESKQDEEGYCACAIMIHEFADVNKRTAFSDARKALGLSAKECAYIQSEINDTPLTFPQIADRIQAEVFGS